MKKSLYSFISKLAIVITSCLLFSSFSPSLDGRAIVVDEGVFPEGLFAKTVGYLPGDIISVANISGEATVDLLVIGALDPSEGVAIMLSPEAAKEIGISKNANNLVKITKRSSQDERVYGTAIISGPAREDRNEEVTKTQETVEETEEMSELPYVEETVEELPEIIPEDIPEETEKEAEVDLEKENLHKDLEKPVEDYDKPSESFEDLQEKFEEGPTDFAQTPEPKVPAEKEVPAEAVEAEDIPQAFEEDEYEAIVLVPAEENPPKEDFTESNIESEAKEEEPEPETKEEEKPEPEVQVEPEPELPNEKEPEPAVEKEEIKLPLSNGIDSYIVENFKDLPKSKYYVQIAVYNNTDNLKEILSKYGKHYPIVFVPMKGKTSYQVLLGPLTVDEYAVVLKRFQSYGFKDSFVRKN